MPAASAALGIGNIAQGMALNQAITQAGMAASAQKTANQHAVQAI